MCVLISHSTNNSARYYYEFLFVFIQRAVILGRF